MPAGPVRAHVDRLMTQGMGVAQISAASGVPLATVCQLLYGVAARNLPPSRHVRTATAQRLLEVNLELAAGAAVCGVGTARRLQALINRGWTQHRLAAALSVNPSNFAGLLDGSQVRQHSRVEVSELFEQLWDVPPPRSTEAERTSADRAQLLAARRGWAPPMAWVDIDDPAAKPKGTAPILRRTKPRKVA